jgi:cell division septation protein DedD
MSTVRTSGGPQPDRMFRDGIDHAMSFQPSLFDPPSVSSFKPTEKPLMMVWIELDGFDRQLERLADLDIADTLNEYYGLVTSRILTAGGQVVKHVGDRILAVFEEDAAGASVLMLTALKPELDAMLRHRGLRCRMVARAHFGVVIAGEFGLPGSTHFDIAGKAVHAVTLLEPSGINLSLDALRKLPSEVRARFRRHGAPYSDRGVIPSVGVGFLGIMALIAGTSWTFWASSPEAGPALDAPVAAEAPVVRVVPAVPDDPPLPVTVPVSIPTSPDPVADAPDSIWTVQVGAFRNAGNATDLLASLAEIYPDAYTAPIDRDGVRWTTVRIGRYRAASDLIRLEAELTRMDLPTYRVESAH